MQLMTLLHKKFEKELPFVHKVRLRSLMRICETAVCTHKLYLTGLGRNLFNKNKTRSNIQKVDRLLSNGHLQTERLSFYKMMILQLLPNNHTPWVHVDWSCINPVTKLYVLRASLSLKGRSIVLYEECHPKSRENNHATHKHFLNHLKKLLPSSVTPIIVTDAGFRAPWFAYVSHLGWDFVGRLRNQNLVRLGKEAKWCLSASYFDQATGTPTYIGYGELTQSIKQAAYFVLYKGKSKNRHKLNINKKTSQSGKSQRHSKAQNEPWLLVTSLKEITDNPKLAVNIYHQRMRIEENFRDTKCPHYGLGLKKSLSQTTQRMHILLLIAAIASFAAWLAGVFTTSSGRAADYQAHSAKITSALSKVFLGREALKRRCHMTKKQFNQALECITEMISQTQTEKSSCA